MSTPEEATRAFAKDLSIFLLGLAVPGGELIGKAFKATASSVVDVVWSPSKLKQIQAEVGDISDRVAREILATLKAEAHTDEYGATASGIDDVKDTIRRGVFSMTMLVEMNLDPRKLQDYMSRFCPDEHTRWASDLRRRVYHRALALTCDYIVSAAPSLPGFSLAMAQSTLEKLDAINEKLDRVLNERAGTPKV